MSVAFASVSYIFNRITIKTMHLKEQFRKKKLQAIQDVDTFVSSSEQI